MRVRGRKITKKEKERDRERRRIKEEEIERRRLRHSLAGCNALLYLTS